MAAPKVMNGARAKVYIDGKLVGIFTNVSYGLTYDAQPAYVLGRYSPAAIDYVAQEPVSITASGWRVIDRGPHVAAALGGAGLPGLQDLLTADYSEFEVYDRADAEGTKEKLIAKITQVRHTGFNTSLVSRQQSEVSLTFMGMMLEDETNKPAESSNAVPEL